MITNRTAPLEIPSFIRSTSPSATCSRAAAEAGSAAGMGCPAAGAPGQWPETSSAWAVTSPSAAASAMGRLPAPALRGVAGSAPVTKSSGSDQSAE